MIDSVADWTAIVADDEPAARRGVRQLLAAFPQFRVSRDCVDGAEVLAALDNAKPDLVFLDIQMPGIDGFEVIRRRTPQRMPIVVFLTAYDQFALRAFDAQALDYLLKPVSAERFAVAMQRVIQQLEMRSTSSASGRIVVNNARGIAVLYAQEVDWIAAEDNYARLWTGARSHLIRESLASLEERMTPFGFIRAHRSALVRIGAVRRFMQATEGEWVAILHSNARIEVSRRRRAAFAAALEHPVAR